MSICACVSPVSALFEPEVFAPPSAVFPCWEVDYDDRTEHGESVYPYDALDEQLFPQGFFNSYEFAHARAADSGTGVDVEAGSPDTSDAVASEAGASDPGGAGALTHQMRVRQRRAHRILLAHSIRLPLNKNKKASTAI